MLNLFKLFMNNPFTGATLVEEYNKRVSERRWRGIFKQNMSPLRGLHK